MRSKIFCFLFLLSIFGFFFYDILTEDRIFSYDENRTLQQFPEFTFNSIFSGKFMDDMETYSNDQIPFRDDFVNISTNIKLLLGQREINSVYIGNNYLFDKFVDSDIDYELLNSNVLYVSEFIKNNNAKFALIPTSLDIMKEEIPDFTPKANQQNLINNIYWAIGEGINIYDQLTAHNDEYIFYKTDHHWTSLGAYYGYKVICEEFDINSIDIDRFEVSVIDDEFHGTIQSKLNIDFSNDILEKYELKNSNQKYKRIVDEMYNNPSDSIYDYEKLKTKEKYAVYIGGNSAITRIYTENGEEDNGRLLLIKDSFSHSLIQFLSNHYSEIVLLDLRYYMGGAQSFIDSEEKFDDILVIFNLKNYIEDTNLIRLNK